MKSSEHVKARLHAAHKKRWADPEYRSKVLAYNAEWFKSHPDASRKNALAWRNRNIELARKNERAWRKSPAGRKWTQVRDQWRRAHKLSVTVNPKSIADFIARTREKDWVSCYYCEELFPGTDVHFDHVIPLSKGGAHSIENLCVSCPHCNQTKINKLIPEWIKLGQQLLEL